MDADLEAVIRRIHGSDLQVAIHVTGGATQALSWLLGVPGASNTVLDAAVPYCQQSTAQLLGQDPQQYCSEATALALARAALRRAATLTRLGARVAGVGATCALASEPAKRGAHRAHVAVVAARGDALVASLQLAKGARSRWQEDGAVSRLLIAALAQAALAEPAAQAGTSSSSGSDASGSPQLERWLDLGLLSPTREAAAAAAAAAGGGAAPAASPAHAAAAGAAAADELRVALHAPPQPLRALAEGSVSSVEFAGGRVTVDAPRPGLVYLPGSFNPLHRGHERLLEAAVAAAGGAAQGCFELSIGNADKGVLAADVVATRVEQFTARGLPLLVTRVPLFTDKAALAPGSSFVLGHDTAVRLVMPKYYGDSATQMALVLDRVAQLGCSFLVAGRVDAGGAFRSLADVDVPPELAGLFRQIPEDAFREDISSTQLRAQAAAADDK